MKKYDAVVILSGDDDHTIDRILAGKKLFHEGYSDELIYNGFPTLEEPSPDFEGDWRNDPILIPYIKAIEEDNPIIIYAYNTNENAYKLAKIAKEKNMKNFLIVTSDFHVQRCKLIFRKFLDPYSTEFIGLPTTQNIKELHKVKIHEKLQEWLCNYYFFGQRRGDDPKKIKDIYNKRKNKTRNLINKLIK